jgi:predicted methyltransferase
MATPKSPIETASKWTPIFDPNTCKYYFWEKSSNTTSWKIPNEIDLPADTNDPWYKSKEYATWYQQNIQAYARTIQESETLQQASFNIKTGKFQSDNSKYHSNPHYSLIQKADNQMSKFFDTSQVYNVEEPLKLTKKQVNLFKKMKKAKKRARLLKEYRDDMY